jgi:hypothetical protein
VRPGQEAPEAAGKINVPVLTIDGQISAGLRPPNLVMIDVEGAEIDVLEGMRKTLQAHRPVVICEVHWVAPVEFLEKFRRISGYDAYDVTELGGGVLPQGADRYHVRMTPRVHSAA